MNSVLMTAFLFALSGLLFVGLSIPLIRNRIPPNRYYGFRTRKTLSDPKIWYEVNRISGVDLFIAGSFITISSLIMMAFAQKWSREKVSMTLLLIMIFSLVGVLVHGLLVLRKM